MMLNLLSFKHNNWGVAAVLSALLFLGSACASPPDEMNCHGIRDLDVCEAEPECAVYRARQIHIEKLEQGGESCAEMLGDEEAPILGEVEQFCTSVHLSYSPVETVYARGGEESDEWKIYLIYNDPDNIKAAGLSKCTEIPEEEEELRFWCSECL